MSSAKQFWSSAAGNMAKLTLKQRKALRNAPKRKRAAMARSMARGGKGDASMLRGIKQGVGRSVAKPYGGYVVSNYHPCAHDAFHHVHMALPRAVGPYTVVRTTAVIEIKTPLAILGPFFERQTDRWTDLIGIEVPDLTKNLSSPGNFIPLVDTPLRNNGAWRAAQCVPAAFSVQIMNPNALQTTSGIVYIGRVRTALRFSQDKDEAGTALANQLVSYNNPRLCAAGKLALRGVQVDAVPFNMADLANFTGISNPSFAAASDTTPDTMGFAPIFVYNPSKISLQALVCIEWRVRFDPSNPAQATHVLHPPATETAWAKAQHMAEMVGNGVCDIADKVANTGQAIYGAMGSMYRVGRGMRALTGAGQLALM